MDIAELWNGGLFSLLMKGEIDTAWYIWFVLFFFVSGIVIPYLFGSINSAVIISRLLYRDDIRNHGSGNAGMTNMLRTYGKGAAGLTLLGDLSKTALAIVCASFLMVHYIIGWTPCLFCMVGHISLCVWHLRTVGCRYALRVSRLGRRRLDASPDRQCQNFTRRWHS